MSEHISKHPFESPVKELSSDEIPNNERILTMLSTLSHELPFAVQETENNPNKSNNPPEDEIKIGQVEVLFLNTEEGIKKVADALMNGEPVVYDFISTYGHIFNPTIDGIRERVAEIRQEKKDIEGKYATVSVVATFNEVLEWMDMEKIHPALKGNLEQLKVMKDLGFIRFPANEAAKAEVGSDCINSFGEIQVLMTEENDPFLTYLRENYEVRAMAVRSANISGVPEAATVPKAIEFAKQIGAKILAVRSKAEYEAQIRDAEHPYTKKQVRRPNRMRQRTGSVPIIDLPITGDKNPVITLVRAANTDPNSVKRLVQDILDETGFGFAHTEEKKGVARKPYDVRRSLTGPNRVREVLKQVSSSLFPSRGNNESED